MFDACLSASSIAVPHRELSEYLPPADEVEDHRVRVEVNDDFVSWKEKAYLEVEEYIWFKDVPPVLVDTTRAIGRLGKLRSSKLFFHEDKDILVIISAFSSVTENLKKKIYNRISPDPDTLSVDLNRFCAKHWQEYNELMQSVEISTQGINVVKRSVSSPIPPPQRDEDVLSLLLRFPDGHVKIDNQLNFKIESVDSDLEKVTTILKYVFDMFGRYVSAASHSSNPAEIAED